MIIGGDAGCTSCPGYIDPASMAYLARLRPNGDTVFNFFLHGCISSFTYALLDDDHIITLGGDNANEPMNLSSFDSTGHIQWQIAIPADLWRTNYTLTIDSGKNIILGFTDTYFNTNYDTTLIYQKSFAEVRKYGTSIISGIKPLSGTDGILVYPNPASDQVHISSTGDMLSIQLTDITGRSIVSREVTGRMQTIEIRYFPKGIYFLQVRTKTGDSMHSVVID